MWKSHRLSLLFLQEVEKTGPCASSPSYPPQSQNAADLSHDVDTAERPPSHLFAVNQGSRANTGGCSEANTGCWGVGVFPAWAFVGVCNRSIFNVNVVPPIWCWWCWCKRVKCKVEGVVHMMTIRTVIPSLKTIGEMSLNPFLIGENFRRERWTRNHEKTRHIQKWWL